MTYARARLWLGICGVGTTVVLTASVVIKQTPELLLPDSDEWRLLDGAALLGFVLCFVLLMLPFDVLGGYVLPRRHGRQVRSFWSFARHWALGVTVQSTLFVLTGLLILAGGRIAGLPGAPVPSVDNRRRLTRNSPWSLGGWHAARTTLFLSWSCLGLLSRAVHCNAGRPELWVLLPTD